MPSRRFQFFATREEFAHLIVECLDASWYLLFEYSDRPYQATKVVDVSDHFDYKGLHGLLVGEIPFDELSLERYQFHAVERGLIHVIVPSVRGKTLHAADMAVGSFRAEGDVAQRIQRAVERFEGLVSKLRRNLRMGMIDCQSGAKRRSIGYTNGAADWLGQGGQLCESGDTTKCYRL